MVNVLILLTRDSPEQTQFALVNIFRRYFFEIEKISALTKVLYDYSDAVNNPWSVLISGPAPAPTTAGLHFYVGHDLLKSHSAVPPTVLGEIIVWLGGVAVFPIAFIIGSLAHKVEKETFRARSPVLALTCLTVTAMGMFLLLNTDTWAFVKRTLFEFILIAFAWFGLWCHQSWTNSLKPS